MLEEDNLRETGLRQSTADVNYENLNRRNIGNHMCPCSLSHVLCCCNTPSLRPLCCYCFGVVFYVGSCAASFYAGYSYEKINYNSTLF